MKKKIGIVLLAALTWLNVYQIGDAGEDAMETLQASVHSAALMHPTLSAPALPEDEDDADLPLVISQALVHSPLSLYIFRVFFNPTRPLLERVASAIAIGLRNLSPPRFIIQQSHVVWAHLHPLLTAPVRSLAPPLPLL